MKNHKKIIISVSIFLIAIVVIVYGLIHSNNAVIPPVPGTDTVVTPPAPLAKTITLGETVTVKQGETYTIVDTNSMYTTTFTVTGFYNHPCPTGSQCIWSGLDIFYTMTGCPTNPQIKAPCFSHEKTQPLQHVDAPYFFQVVDSDYATYAKIIMHTYASN